MKKKKKIMLFCLRFILKILELGAFSSTWLPEWLCDLVKYLHCNRVLFLNENTLLAIVQPVLIIPASCGYGGIQACTSYLCCHYQSLMAFGFLLFIHSLCWINSSDQTYRSMFPLALLATSVLLFKASDAVFTVLLQSWITWQWFLLQCIRNVIIPGKKNRLWGIK